MATVVEDPRVGSRSIGRAQSGSSRFDVVMLTTVHQATDDRIFYREAQTLANAGLAVAVIGRHLSSERLDNIWIEALPNPLNRLKRLFLQLAVLKCGLKLRGELFIFHDPELFLVGLALRILGKTVIYDCHENVAMQLLQKHWIPRPLRWIMMPPVWLAERIGSRLVSGIIVATDAMAARFPKQRTIVVRNFPTKDALKVLGQGPPLQCRQDILIYAGGLSRARGIRELVEAFRRLDHRNAALWLVGEFDDPQFEQEILQTLPEHVHLLGWKKHLEVLELYNSAKIGVILHHPTPSHRNSLPIKIFEYMGAQLPILASNLPEWTGLLEGCGLQVDPFDVEQIKVAIDNLLSNGSTIAQMSKLARNRVLGSYCWEREGKRLLEFCCRFCRHDLAV